MQGTNTEWSEVEQQVAKAAFQIAYDRETSALIHTVCEEATSATKVEDIWKLHDFLSAKRHDIDGKYDYSYAALIFVFARLVQEKWISLDDLSGLEPDKIAKVSALARM
jgi:hypothetical protein